jgi:transporter family protein
VNWLSWALLSALFAGLTAILAKVGVRDVDSDLAVALRTSVVVVFTWGIALVRNRQPVTSLPAQTWLFLVLSGFATGLSWICYFRALKMGEASLVAPIDKLSVVVAISLAVLFLGESLTWGKAIGAGLIVAGSLVLVLWGEPRTAVPAEVEEAVTAKKP